MPQLRVSIPVATTITLAPIFRYAPIQHLSVSRWAHSSYEPDRQSSPTQDHRPLIETFGKLPHDVPILCAFSGADEYFPFQHGVTPEGNFEKWTQAAAEGMNRAASQLRLKMAVIPNASHSVKQPEAQKVLMKVVGDFVLDIKTIDAT